MSIGSPKSRPSAHPLVSSRSAPQLSSAASTQLGRVEPVTHRPPSPTLPQGRLRQLHPSLPGPGSSPDAKHDSPGDAPRDTKQEARHEAGSASALGNSRPGLVRFVGTFMLNPTTSYGEETDALTALTESVQRSVQQQPDTAAASSGETTPHEPDSTQ